MAGLPDRWNPRVRLRDWLNRPTAAEAAAAPYRFRGPVNVTMQAASAKAEQNFAEMYGALSQSRPGAK